MTIDIHALLGKNPVTKGMLRPKFGYKYLGPYNPIDQQVSYDKNSGKIYNYHVKPKNILDEIASEHDTCYATINSKKDKNYCDRIMVKEIDNIPYKDRPYGTFAIKQIINTK